MNLKKSLIAFFIALIPLFIIYKVVYKEKYIYLPIGDALAKGYTPFDNYDVSYVDYYYDYLKEQNPNYNINKKYLFDDIRIKDLVSLLNSLNESDLSQSINNASIITISLGCEELFSKLRSTYNIETLDNTKNFKYIDEMFYSYEELVKSIRNINKKDVYLIGYYSPIMINDDNRNYIKSLFNYLDRKFKYLEKNYKVKYIKINEGFMNNTIYLPLINNAFPTKEGYKYIASLIKKES